MNLKLRNPLAIFDLETTGVDVTKDRIVELSVVRIMPDGTRTVKTKRVNPTVPIPLEASLIHGIYDNDVKDEPTFKQIAKAVAQFFDGCDLAGFNVVKFDLPLLVEEFLRAGVDFDTKNRKIADAQKIFHLMEPRSLGAAYKFYCGKELENAHTAEADTLATWDVLDAQIGMYAGKKIKDVRGNEIEPIKNDMAELHKISMGNTVDFAGRLAYNAKGEVVFNFGKHKDKPVIDVFRQEPSYYDWMMNGDFPLHTKQKLTEIKLLDFNNRR